jgi:16S rRNA (cytidine1402-2'-O)-methyltransferase
VLGEITVVLAGATPPAELPSSLWASLVAEVENLVAGGVRVKDACSEVAAGHQNVRSRQLYDAVLQSRQQ